MGVRMMFVVAVGLLPGLIGCRQVLGLDDPRVAAPDALVPANDRDTDGVADADDNCPDVANPNQGDEDQDGAGNPCDNCPHLANPDQANAGESESGAIADGVGDACDPLPTESGQQIALFLPFDDPAEIETWQAAGANAVFVVEGGRLEQRGQTELGVFWHNDLGLANAWVLTEVTYGDGAPGSQFRGVAVMTGFERSIDFGHGAGCGEMSDASFSAGEAFFNFVDFDGLGFFNSVSAMGASVEAGQTATYEVRGDAGGFYECFVTPGVAFGGVVSPMGPSSGGTGINLAVWGVTASFAYLIAIE